MQTFQQIMRSIGTATLAIIFAFVAIYTPLPYTNNVQEADASGALGKVTDVYNGAINTSTMVLTGLNSGLSAITANASALSLSKDTFLDAIAWGLAKSVLSEMTSSIVDWINNGFEGSPAFVQDIGGFLTKVADKEFGKQLQKLGGPLSSLCSPFKLDIQIALALDYKKRQKPEESTCTLTGVLQNLEKFVEGDFTQGGWDTWFKVVTNPTDYTKYGSYLNAQITVDSAITGKVQTEQKLLDFGGGFLSSKVCDKVETANGGTEEKCKVSTPGKVIQEALTFQLQTGPLSLIEADEVNEIIAALFGQLAKQAITGAAGILGLSNDTGYTTYVQNSKTKATSSITSNTKADTTISEHNIKMKITEAVAQEVRYRKAAKDVALPKLIAFTASTSGANNYLKSLAQDEINNINNIVLPEVISTEKQLVDLFLILHKLPVDPAKDTPTDKVARQGVIRDFINVKTHNKELIDAHILAWDRIYRNVDNNEEEEDAESEQAVFDALKKKR
jgi:hypothetical protein